MIYVPDYVPSSEASESQDKEKAEEGFPSRIQSQQKAQNDEKAAWWPNCTHPRFTKLAQRKFRDRIVILWKCRKCPKEVREVIDIDMNSREVFTKSTKSALPRRYDADPAA